MNYEVHYEAYFQPVFFNDEAVLQCVYSFLKLRMHTKYRVF